MLMLLIKKQVRGDDDKHSCPRRPYEVCEEFELESTQVGILGPFTAEPTTQGLPQKEGRFEMDSSWRNRSNKMTADSLSQSQFRLKSYYGLKKNMANLI